MMIKKILIEGPDCSGKSTLVNRLKNLLKWDAKSLHHLPGEQYPRYLKEYALNDFTIIDRGHISEHVYSCLWRNGGPFSNLEKEILDNVIYKSFLTIFCCPELEIMEKRYSERSYKQQIKLSELESSRKLFIENFKN